MVDEGRSPILHVKQVKFRALSYTTYLAGSVTKFVTHFLGLSLWSHAFLLHVLTVRMYRPVGDQQI